jgi:hypothetical protein
VGKNDWLAEDIGEKMLPIPAAEVRPEKKRKPREGFALPSVEMKPGHGKEIVEDAANLFDFNGDPDLSPDQKIFLIAYMKTGTVTHACKKLRLDPRVVNNWRKGTHFQELMDGCLEAVADELERTALVAAMSGNDRMLTMMLKATRPDKYAERKQVTGKDGGPVQVMSWTEMLKKANEVTIDVDAESEGDTYIIEEGQV